MEKRNYQDLLFERIEQEFTAWFNREPVTEEKLYRFFHTIKGTAGTIGMMELSDYCSSQLEHLTEDSESLVPISALQEAAFMIRSMFTNNQAMEIAISETTYDKIADQNKSFVLVIDDDVEFATSVKECLEENKIQVVIALSGKRGVELFYTLQPHMVIVNVDLLDINGFDVVSQIEESARSRFTPITVVSVNDRVEYRIQAYEIGATDFLAKPLNMDVFIPYVCNRLRHKSAIWLSTLKDELTDAGNRRHFNEVLKQMASLAERKRHALTLVMLDLDYFKKVNDLYGHPVGDEVLKSFSQLVLKMKRETDFFFRYGGEEFALLLSDTHAKEAMILVERMRNAFADIVFTSPVNQTFHVTFSAGISEYRVDQETLLSEADQALYTAKRNGRNQAVIYELNSEDVKRHLNIIIIDDDVLVRKILKKQFFGWKPEEATVHITEYESGVDFLESDWYKTDENYMILLDGIMPKMDGLEVLNHIRSHYSDDHIIISMLTTRANETDIVLALKSGADDYIVKPFHPQEVVARVQRLTQRMFQ